MAKISPSSDPSQQLHRFPQPHYVDSVRWLPPVSALRRHAAVAVFDSDSDSSSLQIHSLISSQTLTLTPASSFPLPSRVTSLRASATAHGRPLLAVGTSAGSLHAVLASPDAEELQEGAAVASGALHDGAIASADVAEGGAVEIVTVGEDGRVNLVTVRDAAVEYRKVFDSSGVVAYTAAKWASPSEFATGGLGFGLQWWDQRNHGAGGPVSQFKAGWGLRGNSGIVHSIDIHPSRKHTCLAGGSLGTVFAWDLRWPQQPIILSGIGAGDTGAQSPSESEVWEVQYDRRAKTTSMGNISSSKVLPAMICSEDGILAVVEQGEDPVELLAEPCAINSFDIDRQNPSFGVGIHSNLDKALVAFIERLSIEFSFEFAQIFFSLEICNTSRG